MNFIRVSLTDLEYSVLFKYGPINNFGNSEKKSIGKKCKRDLKFFTKFLIKNSVYNLAVRYTANSNEEISIQLIDLRVNRSFTTEEAEDVLNKIFKTDVIKMKLEKI